MRLRGPLSFCAHREYFLAIRDVLSPRIEEPVHHFKHRLAYKSEGFMLENEIPAKAGESFFMRTFLKDPPTRGPEKVATPTSTDALSHGPPSNW
jgi:hypothetical protein